MAYIHLFLLYIYIAIIMIYVYLYIYLCKFIRNYIFIFDGADVEKNSGKRLQFFLIGQHALYKPPIWSYSSRHFFLNLPPSNVELCFLFKSNFFLTPIFFLEPKSRDIFVSLWLDAVNYFTSRLFSA